MNEVQVINELLPTTNMPSTLPSAITRTAHDALLAKQSAARAGYEMGDDLYRDCLLVSSSSSRQTPLVNAGYAVRVVCILQSIQTFASANTIVIVLGAGLDVAGVWTALRGAHRVIEIDVPEICHSKVDLVLKKVPFVETSATDGNRVFQGTTATGGLYTLLATDLRNKNEWRHDLMNILQSNEQDASTSHSYLVISELVMTYLDHSVSDDIMEFCSRLPNCCLVAYEPYGCSSDDKDKSVLEEYKRAYLGQFHEKLEKGNSTISSLSMYPLGYSANTVMARMKRFFPRAYVTSAGLATAAHGISLRIPEPFDEYMALTLHLQSYMLACAFSSSEDTLLQRRMCPWSIGFAPIRIPDQSVVAWITPVEIEDEVAIRELFAQSYEQFFATHPSIQKMVNTSLKKDMALTIDDAASSSQMRQWFRDREGDFFVAVQHHPRSVLGGIAVRKCTPKEQQLHTNDTGQNTARDVYELHRLVVHPAWYRRGIGKALLECVERQITSKAKKTVMLTATTFAGLEGANQFYTSCGFSLPQSFHLGDLQMHTYRKVL
ncbi:hypothetical protein FisN_34Lh053 [Fistulifera solaris]|uniref:[phosphatase 2A protein]-leucine-carboxy methyltransferase n=1 Tax=Fistulifera solaris TaxID=1519565 RepID=A0A1Z5JHG2_FISSO|nr:hypothetical protein FisN_34Lh053 [Fistulifera solaris]|eukprot:GAX13447.1 hypothetical protein FisN_34Lh053 [Fistulifera solaris]